MDDHRTTEVARLDALQAALWDDALAGDVAAVDAVLRIVVTRCRVLGLLPGPGKVADTQEVPRTVVVKR